MALTKSEIAALYQKRAGNYDFSANLYYLIGFREQYYRKQAISRLELKPGDTVVELGCGTGLNFELFQQQLGNSGKIIGVDLTPEMLARSQARIEQKAWTNVELVNSDAEHFDFPAEVNGIFSSFALTLFPDYESVIEKASASLAEGGRFVLLDLKLPEKWPMWLIKLGIAITRPFGVSLDLGERRPWEAMEKYFNRVHFREIYGGFAYIAVGE